MPSSDIISLGDLVRLVGTPDCPAIIDVRSDAEAGKFLIPASLRRDPHQVVYWAAEFTSRSVIVVCETGADESPGVAAWLRAAGIAAGILEGGAQAWRAAKLALVPEERLPERGPEGRTIWVTRARPKVDRIACPWLIRRFVDPHAVFLYVAPQDVLGTAEHFGGAPFDIEGVAWSHEGERCTFDAMVEKLGLAPFDALQHLAVIVRGADTGRPELAPEAAGLLAASLGLSHMFADDLEQMEAGMLVYDSFYRWCRDAADETHNWIPSGKVKT